MPTQILDFDLGLQSYKLHEKGGEITYNPTDINVVPRFEERIETLEKLSPEYEEIMQTIGDDYDKVFAATRDMDLSVKEKLAYTFGHWNDFDSFFMGMHIMSLGKDGTPVLYGFLNMASEQIAPELTERLAKLEAANKKAEAAKAKQAANREQRRALAKK